MRLMLSSGIAVTLASLVLLLSVGEGNRSDARQTTVTPPGAAARVLYTPASAILSAAVALKSLPEEDWPYIRFLSAYNVPEARLKEYWQAASFVLNSVSRRRVIKAPVPVVGSYERLVWFDLRWYGISARTLDRLGDLGSGAQPVPEPFFHITLVKDVATEVVKEVDETVEYTAYEPYEYYRNGYCYRTTRQVTRTKVVKKKVIEKGAVKKQTFQTQAPWLPTIEAEFLAQATGTIFHTFRVDWFISYALIEPRYHELLGLGDKEADYQALALLDVGNKDKVELRGSADARLVALNNRILVRYPTIAGHAGGYYWESNDFATSIDGDDVLNDLFPKAKAKEVIFTLANGLQAYGLFNGNGARLDKAGPEFAQDSETKHQDKQVWAARNCISCHANGLRDFENLIKKLGQKKIGLQVADKRKAEKVADVYFSVDIEAIIKNDQAIYAAAIKAANGLTPMANAMQYGQIEYDYTEERLTLLKVAYEVGYPPERILAILTRALNIDHTLVGLLQEPPLTIRREQWDRRGFAQLQLLLIAAGTEKGASPRSLRHMAYDEEETSLASPPGLPPVPSAAQLDRKGTLRGGGDRTERKGRVASTHTGASLPKKPTKRKNRREGDATRAESGMVSGPRESGGILMLFGRPDLLPILLRPRKSTEGRGGGSGKSEDG